MRTKLIAVSSFVVMDCESAVGTELLEPPPLVLGSSSGELSHAVKK
jgi:hypothetical protein